MQYVYPDISYTFETMCAVCGIELSQYLELIGSGSYGDQRNLQNAIDRYTLLCVQASTGDISIPSDDAVLPAVALISDMAKKPFPSNLLSTFRGAVYEYILQQGRELFCYRLFEQALKESQATVWVAANDNTALHALTFLKKKNCPVPADISIIGFDNIARTLTSNLSTYHFNIPAIASAALSYICDPQGCSLGKTGNFQTEVEGTIIERATVSKTRQNGNRKPQSE